MTRRQRREDEGAGRQADGSWDDSKCNHPAAFGRTWIEGVNGVEYEICHGCGRKTGNTR